MQPRLSSVPENPAGNPWPVPPRCRPALWLILLLAAAAAHAGPITVTGVRDTTSSFYLRLDHGPVAANGHHAEPARAAWRLPATIEETPTSVMVSVSTPTHAAPPGGGTHTSDGNATRSAFTMTVTASVPADTEQLIGPHTGTSHTDVYLASLTRQASAGKISSYQAVLSAWHIPGPVQAQTIAGAGVTRGSPVFPRIEDHRQQVHFSAADFDRFSIRKTVALDKDRVTATVTGFRLAFDVKRTRYTEIFDVRALEFELIYEPVRIGDRCLGRQVLRDAQPEDDGLLDIGARPRELLFLRVATVYLDCEGKELAAGDEVLRFALTLNEDGRLREFTLDSAGTFELRQEPPGGGDAPVYPDPGKQP
ncbi:MAG: hypothetical protein M3Z21_03455 [Pseudomonadota bacterium]|nr:hypothetical protein [Pseudomonadota bacterium]